MIYSTCVNNIRTNTSLGGHSTILICYFLVKEVGVRLGGFSNSSARFHHTSVSVWGPLRFRDSMELLHEISANHFNFIKFPYLPLGNPNQVASVVLSLWPQVQGSFLHALFGPCHVSNSHWRANLACHVDAHACFS